MTASIHPRPLFPLAAALAFGMVVGERFADSFPPVALAAGGAICLVLVRAGRVRTEPALWGIFGLLGAGLIRPWAAPDFPARHVVHWVDAGEVTVSGRVVKSLPAVAFGSRFILDCHRLDSGSSVFRVTGRLRIFARGKAPHLPPGTEVILPLVIRPVHAYRNPGGFDYARYLAMAGVWATGRADGGRIRVRAGPAGRWRGWLQRFRRRLSGQIARSVGTGPSAAVIAALVTGDRSAIDPARRTAFNRAGVGHLLAISGLHVGIVAAAAFVLLRWLLAWLPPLLRRAWVVRGAAILAVLPAVAYGLLAGMTPSTQRAVIMVTAALLALATEQDSDLLNTLAAAALTILLISPPALFSVSFQLSFAAVLSIVHGFRCLPGSWRFATERSLRAVGADFFWVALLAALGTLPLIMVHFNQASVVGIAANMVLVPLVGFGIVPLGLASALAGLVCSAAAAAGFQACAALTDVALSLIDAFSSLPFAAVQTFVPTTGEIAGFYALGWAVLHRVKRSETKTPSGVAPGGRRGPAPQAAAWILAGVLVFSAGDAAYWVYRRFGHRDLRITILDVGQGSAALAEFPGGATMLIDGGGFSDNAIFDVGRRLVAPVLRYKRIFTLDTVVLSHPNADHINGLIYVVSHFAVGKIWTNNEPAATRGYRRFVRALQAKGLAPEDFRRLCRRRRIGGVRVAILHPPADFDPPASSRMGRDPNDNSLVVRLEKDGVAVLFPGDITRRAEAELVRSAGDALHAAVLVVPHHGSRRSSSAGFIQAVDPDRVVISAGWRNRFGFPHAGVLARYRRRGCALYRTDRDGAVSVSLAQGRLKVTTAGRPGLNPSIRR